MGWRVGEMGSRWAGRGGAAQAWPGILPVSAPLPRPASTKKVAEISTPHTIAIAIGREEWVPATPTSGAAIEAAKEKPRPSIAEPVPANSRAWSEASAPPLPKIIPCGATVKKNAGSTIHAGVSRNRLPISSAKLARDTTISPTRISRRGWMVRVSRAESSDIAIMPIELIAKLIEYSLEVKPSISWTTKDEAETYAISAKAENALTSM